MSTQITEEVMKSFKPSKTFSYHHKTSITSLDFDDSGQFLISSGVDESIQLYDCRSGKHMKSILSKKYGTHLARFTHHEKNCVYASTKTQTDHTIRYLSLHDNQYIRYFKGHKALVNSIEVSPIEDIFISTSHDNSVRLWDLRTPNCQGFMNMRSPLFTAFDPSGLVFAIACQDNRKIGLYDFKNYDKEPFCVFEPLPHLLKHEFWTKIEFTNNGKYILVVSNAGRHFVLDAFGGEIKARLKGAVPMPHRDYPDTGSLTISPDGRFVYVGSGDNRLLIYDLHMISSYAHKAEIQELLPIQTLVGNEKLPMMVLFNPKLLTLATANVDVTLWLPDSNKE